jgi:beta-lactam-binding protein with PASTA domain
VSAHYGWTWDGYRPALAVLSAGIALGWLGAGCGGADETTRVPPVDTTSLGRTLRLLHAAGLRAEIDSFRRLPGGTMLEGAGVGDQEPEPGTRVRKGSTVHLTMGIMPIPSLGMLLRHPRSVIVPRLLGLPWPQAERLLAGLWPQIVAVALLPAEKSGKGLAAFVVSKQDPPPGTRVPYMGGRIPHGVDLRPSTVRLELDVR